METALFKGAFAFYALSTALGLAYLRSRDQKLTLWMWRFLGVGLAAHLASTGIVLKAFWAHEENRYLFPIHSLFGALSWLALANALVFFTVEGLARLHILGAFVLPWTLVAAGAALFARPETGPLDPALQSVRLNLHPLMLMLSYTAFANAFGVGLAYLVQERQVKSRKPTELCYRLPPIRDLEELHFRLIAAAFPVLSLGLALGGWWAYSAWGSLWDAKVAAALATWLVYLGYLFHRGLGGGRRSVHLAMAGFASLLVTFVVVNYFSAQHGFLYGR